MAPAVYLDHCAVSHLAKNKDLAVRLYTAIKSREGTLVISIINLNEFAGFPSQETALMEADAADAGFVSLWPNLFFIDIDAGAVTERERMALGGQLDRRLTTPCESLQLIDSMEKYVEFDGKGMTLAEGIFRNAVRMRSENERAVAEMKSGGVATMTHFRENVFGTPWYKKITKNLFREFGKKGPHARRKSTDLFTRLLLVALSDQKKALDPNDMVDFTHACVPSVYCDYVSLDRRWSHLVNQVRMQLANGGVSMRLATVVAPTNEGIERLVEEISALPVTVPTPADLRRFQAALLARSGC